MRALVVFAAVALLWLLSKGFRMSPDTILIVLAFVFFVLGALRVAAPVDWMLAALAMLTLTLLI